MIQFLRRRQNWLVWIWFILLSILFTRPLVAHFSDEIIGEIGDNIYFIWMIGWVEKALFKLGVNPLNVWFLNYPQGWNMAHTEITPAQLALGQPFSLLGGEVFAYNMVMLLSFILSGVIMFLWVRELSGSAAAGLISGTVFACLPYRQTHFLIGHLNLSGTQWLPLFFWGWFDLTQGTNAGKLKIGAILKASLGLGLIALTSQYYFFMTVIIAGAQTLFLLLFTDRSKWKDKSFWKQLGIFVLCALPLLIIAEIPFLNLANSGGMPDRDWGSVRMYSAGLSDYLLPSTTHFLFGSWVGAHFDRSIWIEATLYMGTIAFLLFLIGTIKNHNGRSINALLWCGFLTALILSMGTDIHWNNAPVEWTLPTFLSEKLGRETLPLLLPGFFLFKFFPFYAKLRAMMRFGIFAMLMCACGAGMGITRIQKRFPKHKSLLTVLALVLILFDFFPKAFTSVSRITPRPVDSYLASRPESGSVMRYPFSLNDDQAGTYYSLYNEKPFIGGFFNAFPTEQYTRVKDVMNGFPSVESLSLSRESGVSFVLLERDEFIRQAESGEIPWNSAEEWMSAAERLGLIPSEEFENITLYCLDE